MTNTMTAPADTAARRQAYESTQGVPSGAQRAHTAPAQIRSSIVERNGKEFVLLDGTASVVERWYEMWDYWGQYEEKVARGAFDKTLANNPDVSFLLNHKGTTMARTRVSKTLELFLRDSGDLGVNAYCNPKRQDVADLRHAIDDGDITEMSFAFRITDGSWNHDFTQFTILEVDLDRGDVSAVNYGANPFTSISARAQDTFASIESLPLSALRAVRDRAAERIQSLAPELREDGTATQTEDGVAPAAPIVESIAMAELAASLED